MKRGAAVLVMMQLVWGSACATKTPVTLASSRAAGTQAVDPWENVLTLERGTRLQVLLTDGSWFEGRLADVTANQIALSLDRTSTALWYRSEVRGIRVHESGRGLNGGATLAGRATGDLWASWAEDAAGPGTNDDGAALTAILFGLATPFVAGGAFVVGTIKGAEEWKLIYLVPRP